MMETKLAATVLALLALLSVGVLAGCSAAEVERRGGLTPVQSTETWGSPLSITDVRVMLNPTPDDHGWV